MTEKVGGYMNFRGFSSLRKYGIFEDFHFLTGGLGPMGPRGLGTRGPWGPGALGPRYYYQGLGAHGPWGPGALGPRYYYQGPGAPGVCPTNYGGPCIWRVNKVNERPHVSEVAWL